MHSDKVSTTASESCDRKRTKPIMEKRRRARINASLAELKSLLLEAIKKEGARSKMEKADILEMTVKHVRDMQRQSFTAKTNGNLDIKHRLGYSDCTQEVSRYLNNIEGCDAELRTKLLDHLAKFVSGTKPSRPPSPPATTLPVTVSTAQDPLPSQRMVEPSVSQSSDQPQTTKTSPSLPLSVDINNNISTVSSVQQVQPTTVMSGLQVIPTKLQTGEIAFVLPGNVIGTNPTPNYILPVYTSPNSSAKPTVTMTTAGLTSPGSFMTIIPSTDVIQTCTLAPLSGNISIVPQAVSATQSSVSPSSISDCSVLSVSPPLLYPGNDMSVKSEIRHHDVRPMGGIRHQDRVLHHDFRDEIRHNDEGGLSLGKIRSESSSNVGGVRHNDVRDMNELNQQRISCSQIWRPW